MAFSPAAAFSYLRRAHEQGRFAHAYLISGAPGTGKRELASRLANLVNGTDARDVFASGTPNVYLAAPGSKSRRIVIDQIRGLEHALQMRAPDGRKKVAIISDADRLQPQAANAFLKTLEEPPNDSLLLLLSALPEALPDTILSRCLPDSARSAGQDDSFRGRAGVDRGAQGECTDKRGAGRVSIGTGFSGSAQESARSDPGGARGGVESRGGPLQEYHRRGLARMSVRTTSKR